MKKFILLFIISIALVFQACDKIDGPYTTPVPAKDWYGKKILLEDYTGHACINCPGAANTARNLEALYGDKIVVMAVHVGYFAQPSNSTGNDSLPQDFRTIAGNDWDAKFQISPLGLPQGMINRIGFPTNSQALAASAWASKISSVLAELPYMQLTFQNNNYAVADSTLSGKVNVKILKANNYKLKLSICITEDSIIAPQKDINAPFYYPAYVHMHMLRGAINGSWGNQLTDGTSYNLVGTELLTPYTYSVPKSKWKVKNCHIVAFVYDANTYEVLQVEEIPMQ